jgi:hypothetical protein
MRRSTWGAFHEQPRRSDACRAGDSQKDIIAAVFRALLFKRNYRRDHWLGISLRLGRGEDCKLADVLVQIFDVLSELYYPAADHDPECKIYFQRDPHRASPHF